MFEMYEGAHFFSLAISKGFRYTRIIRQTSYSKSLRECSSFPNIRGNDGISCSTRLRKPFHFSRSVIHKIREGVPK